MYKKTETRDYIWVIPLVAGFLAIIAILSPTAYFSYEGVTWLWWMWDFMSVDAIGYNSISLFISDGDFIILSIITTSAVLLSAVNLLILSIKTRRRNFNTKGFNLMSIISAVLSIGIMIYYIIALDIAFNDGMTIEGTTYPAVYLFWDIFNPGFGIILPFMSATLSFIGVGVFRYYLKQKEDFIPPKMDPIKEYLPLSKTMGKLNFCPECGYKILLADANFCISCGFKF